MPTTAAFAIDNNSLGKFPSAMTISSPWPIAANTWKQVRSHQGIDALKHLRLLYGGVSSEA